MIPKLSDASVGRKRGLNMEVFSGNGWRRLSFGGLCVLAVGCCFALTLLRDGNLSRSLAPIPPDDPAAVGELYGNGSSSAVAAPRSFASDPFSIVPVSRLLGDSTSFLMVDGFGPSLSGFPVVVKLERARVHDGDTLKGDLAFPCRLRLASQTIRGSGWDSPEVTRTRATGEFKTMTDKQWKEEIARGVIVRDALRRLLNCDESGIARNGVWLRIVNDAAAYDRLECDAWVEIHAEIGGKKIPAAFDRVSVRDWIIANGYDRSAWGVKAGDKRLDSTGIRSLGVDSVWR